MEDKHSILRYVESSDTIVVVVVVLTSTHRHNAIQSVVAPIAPWKNTSGENKTNKQAKSNTHDDIRH